MQYTEKNLLTLVKRTIQNPRYQGTKFLQRLNTVDAIHELRDAFNKGIYNLTPEEDAKLQEGLIHRFFILSLDVDQLEAKTSPNDIKMTRFISDVDRVQASIIDTFESNIYSSAYYAFTHGIDFMRDPVTINIEIANCTVSVLNTIGCETNADQQTILNDFNKWLFSHTGGNINLPRINPLTGKHYAFKYAGTNAWTLDNSLWTMSSALKLINKILTKAPDSTITIDNDIQAPALCQPFENKKIITIKIK